MRRPGHIKPGTTCNEPIIGSDFFTTALSVAGVKPPADRVIDGADVLPVLTGKAETIERKQPPLLATQHGQGQLCKSSCA